MFDLLRADAAPSTASAPEGTDAAPPAGVLRFRGVHPGAPV
jgi:hypothetical protein